MAARHMQGMVQTAWLCLSTCLCLSFFLSFLGPAMISAERQARGWPT